MPVRFTPYVLKNGDFEALECDPVTARQAAAMLQTSRHLLLFVRVRKRLRKGEKSCRQAQDHDRWDGDQACP